MLKVGPCERFGAQNAVGYDVDVDLSTVKKKLNIDEANPSAGKHDFGITTRSDARHLRTQMKRKVEVNRRHAF